MKKTIFTGLLVAMLAVFGFTSLVSAQGPNPPEQAPGNGYVHEYLIAYAAEAFGMDVATLEARLAAGETLAQVAFAEGYEDFTSFMQDARSYVLAQLAEQGITIPGWSGGRGNAQFRAQMLQNGECPALNGEGAQLTQMMRGFRGGR